MIYRRLSRLHKKRRKSKPSMSPFEMWWYILGLCGVNRKDGLVLAMAHRIQAGEVKLPDDSELIKERDEWYAPLPLNDIKVERPRNIGFWQHKDKMGGGA